MAFRAAVSIRIDAPTPDEAQTALAEWVAETMPENFVMGWTLTPDNLGVGPALTKEDEG
jgi:hypothetical protein